MGLQRFLIIVGLLFVAWRILMALAKRQSSRWAGSEDFSRFSARRRDRRERFGGRGETEELVECSACGTMVPSRRALAADNGELFCSESCLRGLTETTGGADRPAG